MKNLVLKGLFPIVVVCLSPLVWAQSAVVPGTTERESVVPTLVNYSGVLTDSAGNPLSEITGVTFLLYKDHQGGAPLWLETQNIRPDSSGHYTVTLGATDHEGLPADLSPQWRAGLINHLRAEHTTPEDVGMFASKAGVKMVVLSHVAPGLSDGSDATYVDGVKKFYSGSVVLGHDLMEF